MITLCMDTSHRYLVLGLLKEDNCIASYVEYAWKKQSEKIFVELLKLMEEASVTVEDIDSVVISIGPGSYTGIRIAMSIAKVLCTTKNIQLYTISTLQLYAGIDTCHVLLDARSNRVYYGNYEKGTKISESIKELSEVQQLEGMIVGDTQLIGIEEQTIDFINNFIQLRPFYTKVDNIHTLVPEYLKEEDDYLVK